MRKLALFSLVAVAALAGLASPVAAQTTLRVVMHSDLKIVDPIWTTAGRCRRAGKWPPISRAQH
jgi:peptide/nickel transport system substrate-binding protein